MTEDQANRILSICREHIHPELKAKMNEMLRNDAVVFLEIVCEVELEDWQKEAVRCFMKVGR